MNRNELDDRAFEEHFRELQRRYEASGSEEDLAALILWTDRRVEYEKRFMDKRQQAFRKLTMLEEVAELQPLQRYRKAVLNLTLGRKAEAFDLFMELMEREDTEAFVKDRTAGYLLGFLDDFLRQRQKQPLLERLHATEDRTALQLMEHIDMQAMHEAADELDELTDAWEGSMSPEMEWIAFSSEDRQRRSVRAGRQETLWRERHRPEQYDLFLDFVQDNVYARGELTDIRGTDASVLAAMALYGSECDLRRIFLAKHGRRMDPANRTERNQADQYVYRLRKRLASLGIAVSRHSYSPETTYCVLYPESMELGWES